MAEAMSQNRKAAFSLARHSTGIIASVLFLAPIVANLIGKVDPRFLMSLGLGLVALDTFWRTTFNTDISFWGLVPAQMALGLGMPLFFLPMMSMSMGAVKPEETASAAGLINFLRTMAGAFATGVIVALVPEGSYWDWES